MTLTRRQLVASGGAATAALYLGPLSGIASAAVPKHLVRSSYAGLSGTTFTAGTSVLRLAEVADLARASAEPAFAGAEDAFALFLQGPAGIEAGTHELRHPSLGAFSVFVAPVGRAGAEQAYEVVVDRSVRIAGVNVPEPMAAGNAAAADGTSDAAAASGASGASGPSAAPGASDAPAAGDASAATGSGSTRSARGGAAEPGARKQPKAKLVQAATVARRGGVVCADVRVGAGRGVVSVRASLLRGDVVVATASRKLPRGKVAMRIALRRLRAAPAGAYVLRVVVTDRTGKRTASTRRVTLR